MIRWWEREEKTLIVRPPMVAQAERRKLMVKREMRLLAEAPARRAKLMIFEGEATVAMGL